MSRGQTGEVLPGERQLVPCEGPAALQLAELISQGWVVLERQATGWLLERLQAPVRAPASWPRPAHVRPSLPPASVRTAPLSRR